MSYDIDETSIDNAEPIELYLFTYNGVNYSYTSSQYAQNIIINGQSIVFVADYIVRSETLRLGDSSGSVETCTIRVARNNNVALLYQGSPPELGSVRVQVFRLHGENTADYIKILDGIVSQVSLENSEATITVTIEHFLNREIPKGALSYYCQNCIYDSKCRLNADDWKKQCFVDGAIIGVRIYSSNLATVPSGYYTDGFIQMGNSFRAVLKHENDMILLKYPIPKSEQAGSFYIYPGCSNLFSTCARRFNNTNNFSGVPYCMPYDVYKNPANKGVYWVMSSVVVRDTNCFINP